MNEVPGGDSISLRSVTDADKDFLLELYQSSRGDDLRQLGWEEDRISEFLSMQHEAQQLFYQTDYLQAVDEIILIEGEPTGRLIVERREHEIRCVDLALLPGHRGAGVGTFLIQRLQEEARQANKPLRLQIIRFNRAVTLLERLGFVRTSETGTHFQMEWRSPAIVRSLTVREGD
jgi:GNAT superfamily N-acetyltransferase